MDWHAWLSSTRLEPTVAYEYGLLFAHNELEEEDIPHFDHQLLLSMGISVAKHRLEILKLAKEEWQRRRPSHQVAKLLAVADGTRKRLARHLRSLARGGRTDSSTPAVVPRNMACEGRWSAELARNKRLALVKQGRLMLTMGDGRIAGPTPSRPSRSRSASPLVYGLPKIGDDNFSGGSAGEGEENQEMRWESMFQDLKPT